MVQADGDNAIVVAAGANGLLDGLRPDDIEAVEGAAVLVAQLEVPLAAVLSAAPRGQVCTRRRSCSTRPRRSRCRRSCWRPSTCSSSTSTRRRSSAAAVDSAPVLVVTLGAAGARITDAAGTREVPGIPAKVVDTTGAGDAFTGYLAAGLAAGLALDAAVARAVVAGALAVETAGAVPSIPDAAAVDARSRG